GNGKQDKTLPVQANNNAQKGNGAASNSNQSSAPGQIIAATQNHIPVCPGPAAEGNARCHARVIVDGSSQPAVTTLPQGYGPLQFRGAYGVSGSVSTPSTIAIVDAYDAPNVRQDLQTYANMYSLPSLGNCAVSSGTPSSPCFQKVNQTGGQTFPKPDQGWALEISLDVEAAHAMCGNCNILLVEANSASFSDLLTAVDRARNMGAKIISGSWGGGESSSELSYDSHFNFGGIAFTFSSGDNGYGVIYPSASSKVTSVGGTTLNLNTDNTYSGETAWSGAGSGCSSQEAKPSFQSFLTLCGSKRIIADVSADADPNTGAAVYDSTGYKGVKGWFKVGGTSLAAPLIAATYAQGILSSGSYANSLPYSNSSNLHDVTSGSNGSCGSTYLCKAGAGYDGPTGLGTPNGVGAF
ncbi:MAG: S53 family peptidase, partial [Candidatus Pacebacteria bacterium]|nr:S53 family peptidase [Candidatus Paceibacterota bacterium]